MPKKVKNNRFEKTSNSSRMKNKNKNKNTNINKNKIVINIGRKGKRAQPSVKQPQKQQTQNPVFFPMPIPQQPSISPDMFKTMMAESLKTSEDRMKAIYESKVNLIQQNYNPQPAAPPAFVQPLVQPDDDVFTSPAPSPRASVPQSPELSPIPSPISSPIPSPDLFSPASPFQISMPSSPLFSPIRIEEMTPDEIQFEKEELAKLKKKVKDTPLHEGEEHAQRIARNQDERGDVPEYEHKSVKPIKDMDQKELKAEIKRRNDQLEGNGNTKNYYESKGKTVKEMREILMENILTEKHKGGRGKKKGKQVVL